MSRETESRPARVGGATSSTIPPATVSLRPISRRTNRSKTSSTMGRESADPHERLVSRLQRIGPQQPDRRRRTLRAPTYTLKAPRCVIGCARSRTGRRRPSKRSVARHSPGRPRTSPRSRSSRSVPTRFAATRLTGQARSSARLCVWSERIRVRRPVGIQLHVVPHGHALPGQRARHHGARALDREHPVDEEPCARRAEGLARRRAWRRALRRAHRCPRRSARTRRRSGRPRAPCPRPVRGRRVRSPGARRRPRGRASSARPRPPSTPSTSRICRCSSDCRRHPSSAATTNSTSRTGPDAREHVRDEALVTRHVDEADLASRGQRAPGVPEIDRQSAPLLLREAIGVDARQPHDQGRLPVVDVARRGHDSIAAGVGRHSIAAGGGRHAGHRQSSIRSSPSSA